MVMVASVSRALLLAAVACAVVLPLPGVQARAVQVNLTASWPSSPFYPLLETSEFLADENPRYFWRYVDALASRERAIADVVSAVGGGGDAVDALTEIAITAAEEVAPNTKNMIELTVATRMYAAKVEMFRQLALDSGVRPCGPTVEAWAVVYKDEGCATAVACSSEQIEAALETLTVPPSESTETCVAAGMNDVAQSVDHVYPRSPTASSEKEGTVILYGLLGSSVFRGFHSTLAPLAKDGQVTYIVRHYPRDSQLDTLLQGYGIALDIKNMEYKTIDDSKKAVDELEMKDDKSPNGDDDDDDDDENGIGAAGADDDVDGLYFTTLVNQHASIHDELKAFRDLLVKQHDQEQEIKAWQLQDIGLAATREILDARAPLRRLRMLAQDFPKYARKLALSRKPISDELRDQVQLHRSVISQSGLLNRFLINGIVVDPMLRSFNIFEFMSTLKKEWSVAKQLAALPLVADERQKMLENVQDSKAHRGSVRIRVRGAVDGAAPFYLNDIETDYGTTKWPREVNNLRRRSWNLVFLRKNMYEYVIVFDPMSAQGRVALSHIAFMRMRGAPIQWGMLISTKELMDAATPDDRAAIVEQYKLATLSDKVTGWHFAKMLVMTKAKEVELSASGDGRSGTGRMVSGFIEGVADEPGDLTLEALVNCYVDATGGSFARPESEVEALEQLRSSKWDDEVMQMTEFIGKKHLPFDSSLFNGVLKMGLDLQSEIMANFGRDQELYQEMTRHEQLDNDMDLVDELLTAEGAFPAFFSLFNGDDSDTATVDATSGDVTNHLFANDESGALEALVNAHVTYIHQANTITSPKKQTLLFSGDLGNRVHAAHVYEAVKGIQEDLGSMMRVGIIHRNQEKADDVGELVAAIINAVGDSDTELHSKIVLESLACITKGKTLKNAKSKLSGIIEKNQSWKDDPVMVSIKELVDSVEGTIMLEYKTRTQLSSLNDALVASHGKQLKDTPAWLFLNGFRVDLPQQPITNEDIVALTTYDMKYRSQPVARAFIKRSAKYTAQEANARSMEIVKASAILDEYRKVERVGRVEYNHSSIAINLPGDDSLNVVAYVDPLSEAAQRMSSLLVMLHSQLNASIELLPLPELDYGKFPLERFYRFLFEKRTSRATRVQFKKLPIKPILTMKIDTPEAWNVQIHTTADDLDNLRVDPDSPSDVRATKTASFQLESLLVYGQCRDKTFDRYTPPNGLQLVLERDIGGVHLHRDTLVMKNLGYFQLQATPGVWSLHLARGRARELFEIVDMKEDKFVPSTNIIVSDFTSRLEQLFVQKRPGMEQEVLLAPVDEQGASQPDIEPIAADAGVLGGYWNSMISLFKKPKASGKDTDSTALTNESDSGVNHGRTGETIHVFSLASGHLYERFIKIMMLSVLKRTDNPVTFWLLENFLSPDFKASIPALRDTLGMDIRLVTYKWPNWLRQQTQKQRIIWGYKILFLDVLFPLGVQKIIYVDADQVVRADLKELWEHDLHGAPYGYTPFCDSRNVGFQFWRQGYWKDHLRGRPYHISALYVVDLALFRQMAAGDLLRATYDQLSADPNSLSNLDQDLPNYMQNQIRIHSLPQEWLWCESWCSDESKASAKTIDLCNNPKHKEPKLDMAKRVIAGDVFQESWLELDQEVKDAELAHAHSAAVEASDLK